MIIRPKGAPNLFKVTIPDREDWGPELEPEFLRNSEVWYTDGSVTGERAGAGVFAGTGCMSRHVPLGRHITVFQAEVFAILICGQDLLSGPQRNGTTVICSDSKAAIRAIEAGEVRSKLVMECREILQALSRASKVTLAWVPGHMDVPGNVEADRLARLGAREAPLGPEPTVGISYNTAVLSMKAMAEKLFQQRWVTAPGMRQAKNLIHGPCPKRTKLLLNLNRSKLRTVTGLMTGHCHLARHMHLLGIHEDPACRGCMEDEETPEHVLGDCPAFSRLRHTYLGQPTLRPRELKELCPNSIVRFFESTGLSAL